MPGVPERRTQSYVRHGTTSLFAALDVASGCTSRRLRRHGLPSLPESGSVEVFIPLSRQLEADIRAFIVRHNLNPSAFRWTKSADEILASVKRFCHKAQQTLCGEL